MEVTETNRYKTPSAGLEAAVKPQSCSLHATLRPLFLLSRVWGFGPLILQKSAPVVESSAPTYSSCAACVLIATHVAAMFLEVLTAGPTYRHVRYVARTGVIIFNRLCSIGNVLFLLAYQKILVSAVASVVALDEEWKPAGNEKAATFIYVEFALMLCVVTTEVYSLVIQNSFWPLILFGVWQRVAAIQSLSLLILQWSNLAYSLVCHMSSLNDELAKQYPESNSTFAQRTPRLKKDWKLLLIENEINQGCRDKLQSEEETAQLFSNISLLRRHHRDIYDTLQKLQAAYGMPLTVGFAIGLVNSVIAVFRVKNSIGNVNSLDFLWALWTIVLSWLMVFPCQMLLNKLLNFSVQLLDLPLTCSPSNFFQLDNRKLISVLGTIVTYAIILSQFDSPIKRTRAHTTATNCTGTEWIPET